MPNHSEPEPDLAIVERLGREYLEHHPQPENIFWLIEYSDSSLDKDLEIKSKIYAKANIPEYWVVNLKQRWLVVFRDPVACEYTSKVTLTTGTIQPLSFSDRKTGIQAPHKGRLSNSCGIVEDIAVKRKLSNPDVGGLMSRTGVYQNTRRRGQHS